MADETDPPEPEPQPDAEPDRLAQPVDAEQPPRLPFPVVGVGASAGGLEAFSELLAAMRPDGGIAFVLVQHLPPDRESLLAEILARRTAMTVRQVEDGMEVGPDHVYVIRPGHVLTIHNGRLRLGPELGGPRAANRPVDDFFRSLAEEQRERAVCVVLSGMGSNGTAGAQAVKAVGGLVIAQDPETAQHPSMPRHLIDAGYADYIARPAEMPEILLNYAGSAYATGGREADARTVLEREQQHMREVLAVLRTRSKHDFRGYKKPTLLRRVQRRMGLTRVGTIGEYARLLRQTPAEVQALADDLLIHVTGFFRDPEAWDVLREKVVAPLVATREAGGTVRAWVAACSSGEEAYSLAMLLTEESERSGKRLDIKVFATDLAERTLAHARAGIYPGGIESEISPERLARFFTLEDEVYRVRQDLRDRVVYAPQNILQDPPFSRIDIASCRNLLIYLEPEVQQRVLGMLHFGLREGGALFLGTSETVSGADDLFEPLDRKARIYRRLGPTRHGQIDFPSVRPVIIRDPAGAAGPPAFPSRPTGRPVLAELSRQTLLEHHAPPAVTVDRDHQVVLYHGETHPFLRQVSGEPTRDLLLLARDGVRAAVRVAVVRAAATGRPETVPEGWVEAGADRRLRVRVTASPILTDPLEREAPPDHFVVSFEALEEIPLPGRGVESGTESADELRRLRGELQCTVEELQTSNEELKASNEEAMSLNEELQSANEELETSKEEMQSLNEELRTVNAQLQAKMEDHLAAASDLASLLASTDIAVLFLDPHLGIRRYTPAVRELIDLIAADIGRPLAALAWKFDDPDLEADCREVLDRLVPTDREVSGSGGKSYLRRATPYRTTDNRIDGVVVTFVDITARREAEGQVRERGEWLRGQREALEAALNDAPLGQSLGVLVRTATDALDPGTRGAFYLVSGDGGTLHHVVGMPAAYAAEVDGFRVGPESLACGLATATGQPVLTTDVMTDPRWVPWRGVAERFDYRGCWSFPIHSTAGRFVGTFAAYSRQPREATARDLELATLLTHTASIIISRHTKAEARRRAEGELAAELASMSRLREVADRLLSMTDLPTVMGEVLDAAIALHGADKGTVQVYDRDGDGLRYIAHRGFDAAALLAIPVIDRDFHSTCAAAIRTGARVVAADIPADAEFAEHAASAAALGYRAAISSPLTTRRGEFQGVLTVHFREPHVPTDQELRLADLYAVLAAHRIERHRAEAALRLSEERLRLALSAARMGIWTFDPETDAHTRDPNLNRLLGLEAVETTGPFADFLARVHPDDRTEVEAAFAASRREGRPLRTEFRVVWTDGTVRWLRDQGDVYGTPGDRRMTGACVDITDRREAEEAVRASEERLRLILASATDYAILTQAPDRTVTGLSPGGEVIFGYTAGDLVGRSGDLLFTPEDRAAGAPAREADTARRDGRAADERWHVRKDGSRFYASGVLTPLAGGGGFVKVARDLTDRKRLEDELRDARDRLEERVAERTAELERVLESLEAEMQRRRELARRLSTSQEDERRRVSRDLHDSVGQLLAGLSLSLKAVGSGCDPSSPASAKLAEAQRMLDQLGREVHGLAVRLRPTSLDDIGLEAALRQLVAEWSSRTGVRADFHASGLARLPADLETAAYRVVQEALTNVARHAGATSASVAVTRQDGSVSVVVEDDGAGFDPGSVPSGRLGLVGMRERIELVGGSIEIESSPGAGTIIAVRVPVRTGGEP